MALMWHNVSGGHGRKANVFKERQKETRLCFYFLHFFPFLTIVLIVFTLLSSSLVCVFTLCVLHQISLVCCLLSFPVPEDALVWLVCFSVLQRFGVFSNLCEPWVRIKVNSNPINTQNMYSFILSHLHRLVIHVFYSSSPIIFKGCQRLVQTMIAHSAGPD